MQQSHQKKQLFLAKKRNKLAIERTRFAAERTFSAWMRTSLASVAGGFAIIRFLIFNQAPHRLLADAIGEILILWGIVILTLALADYRKSCREFKGKAKRNEIWVTTTAFIFITLSLFLFFAAFD